jgi:hypothetical protein
MEDEHVRVFVGVPRFKQPLPAEDSGKQSLAAYKEAKEWLFTPATKNEIDLQCRAAREKRPPKHDLRVLQRPTRLAVRDGAFFSEQLAAAACPTTKANVSRRERVSRR